MTDTKLPPAFGSAEWILARTRARATGGSARVAAIAVPLYRAAERLSQAVAGALSAHGLQRSEFEVLQTLLLAEGQPLTPGDLYGALLVSSGGVTKIVERLRRRGLVALAIDAGDRRRRLITFTGPGRDLAEQAERDVIAAERDCLRGVLADPACAGLAEVLPRMIALVEAEGARR